MLESAEVLNLRNSGETCSQAPRDGETGAHFFGGPSSGWRVTIAKADVL